MVELVEVAPNKWRVKREETAPARSRLAGPYVISDTMEPTEQVDGKFYTSKRAFRATGKALGLIEVGTEKFPKRERSSATRKQRDKRRGSLKLALDQYKAGYRYRRADHE